MAITSSANRGLEIGRRALQAQQAALNVTSHNIANANTPGFSRRQVQMETAMPELPGGIGSGADVDTVVRQRSRFLDSQVRVEQQVLGRWEALEKSLGGLEDIFNELGGAGASEAGTVFNQASGVGLSGSLSRFWNTWQDLANNPESGAARATVRQEADFLTTSLHQFSGRLQAARDSLDEELVAEVESVNRTLDELAEVNAEIPRSHFDGGTAGDLEDKRDLLIEELSTKIDIAVVEQDNGQVSVMLGGHNLLQQTDAVHLALRQIPQQGDTAPHIYFTDDRSPAVVGEGSLRGLTEVRDEVLPGYLSRLDQVAGALVEEVNRVHRAGLGADGSTGVDFFDPDRKSAGNIALSATVQNDLNSIAASGDGNIGDNGAALAISGLRNRRLLAGGTATIEEFYESFLAEVGAASKEAQTMAENHRLFATQIENRRQSVQGVSLNDEAAQLVMFQRAYQAAARTIAVVDQLMEETIGLVA
jgi:flagellar hook-associated protein 1 FlgK